jgi:citrate synthase
MSYTLETGISQAFTDRIEVRGYDLVTLAGRIGFGEMVYLLLRGELPAPEAGQMIETMLVIMAEHSINAPSTFAARTVANSGSPLQTAVAAGISAIGDHHGGAGEACARILQKAVAAAPQPLDAAAVAARIVATAAAGGQRLPGFGHRVHNPDPRAVYLLALGRELGLTGPHTEVAEAIVAVLHEQTGRALPLNVDGALAALSSDMGFDPLMAKGLFILARTAGLLAHVQEEITQGKPMKFAPRAEIRYTGPVRTAGDTPL